MRLMLMMISLLIIPGQSSSCEEIILLDEEVTLKYGQTIEVKEEKLKIKFVSVSEDSRCPQGEQCIRAGNAAVVLELAKKNSKASSVTLNTSNEPQEVSYENLGVRLIGLQPHPKSGIEITPHNYVITLQVYKHDEQK